MQKKKHPWEVSNLFIEILIYVLKDYADISYLNSFPDIIAKGLFRGKKINLSLQAKLLAQGDFIDFSYLFHKLISIMNI
jgi:hypothetical protein